MALVRRNRRARRLRAALRADRVFRDRLNPLEMDEDDVRDRFRFRPPTIRWLCDLLRPDLERPTDCSSAIPVLYVVCIGLRFLATGGFLITVGDLAGVSKATACRCVWGFVVALCRRIRQFIHFPRGADAQRVQEGFYGIAGW
jgi:hypothetical protein